MKDMSGTRDKPVTKLRLLQEFCWADIFVLS